MSEFEHNNDRPEQTLTPRLSPHENHNGIDFLSPLQDYELQKIQATTPFSKDSFTFEMLDSLISAEQVDIEHQQENNNIWGKVKQFFRAHPEANQYLIESKGKGYPIKITRNEDPFVQMSIKLEGLRKTISQVLSDKQVGKEQLDNLFDYVRRQRDRWEKRAISSTSDLDEEKIATINAEIFSVFLNLVATTMVINNNKTFLEKLNPDSPQSHPYLQHAEGKKNTSPKRYELLNALKDKFQQTQTLSFDDLAELLSSEQEDYKDQFKQLNGEIAEAVTYFDDHPDDDSVTIYTWSDGTFSMDTDQQTKATLTDKRIFARRDINALNKLIDSFGYEDGIPSLLKSYIDIVNRINEGKKISQLDENSILYFLRMDGLNDAYKDIFDEFKDQVELYYLTHS